MRLSLPERGIDLEIPERHFMGVFQAPKKEPGETAQEATGRALTQPIGSLPLAELASRHQRALILVDDNTRPTPADVILPEVLEHLANGGIPREECTILIAGGTHRAMDEAELAAKLGSDVASSVKTVQHSVEKEHLAEIQVPEIAFPIHINRLVVEHDLIIAVGEILPHPIVGFSGGGKMVAPGACGTDTIAEVHWALHAVPYDDVFGRRDHKVRERIDSIAAAVGLRFIVNVITDGARQVVEVVAGDPVEAHRRGAEISRSISSVSLPRRPDIVVADSTPCDLDYWQAIKALIPAGMICKPGGVVIQVAGCREGFSPLVTDPLLHGYPPPEDIIRMVNRDGTLGGIAGAHMLMGSYALGNLSAAYLISEGLSTDEIRALGFNPAGSAQEALEEALNSLGSSAQAAVLLESAHLIPVVD